VANKDKKLQHYPPRSRPLGLGEGRKKKGEEAKSSFFIGGEVLLCGGGRPGKKSLLVVESSNGVPYRKRVVDQAVSTGWGL